MSEFSTPPRTGTPNSARYTLLFVFGCGVLGLIMSDTAYPLVLSRTVRLLNLLLWIAGAIILVWGSRTTQQENNHVKGRYWALAAVPWLFFGLFLVNVFGDLRLHDPPLLTWRNVITQNPAGGVLLIGIYSFTYLLLVKTNNSWGFPCRKSVTTNSPPAPR